MLLATCVWVTFTSGFSNTVIGVSHSFSDVVSVFSSSSEPVQYTSMCTVRDFRFALSSLVEESDLSESAEGPTLVVSDTVGD